MSDAKLTLAVLQRISEFLADLPEEHVAAIAEGRARLTFIPADTTDPWTPAKRTGPAAQPNVNLDEVRERLSTMDTREEGKIYLHPMRVKQELQPLARLLGMGGVSGLKHDDLVDAVVERTIGSRLNSAAIRQL